ncbi:hypothetical protein T484DRAFT_1980300 [Baffinella frigidus]|nr:hypothetical protein T484DRAFT_1980300 [Cryptophyta sp. CCMP2293]
MLSCCWIGVASALMMGRFLGDAFLGFLEDAFSMSDLITTGGGSSLVAPSSSTEEGATSSMEVTTDGATGTAVLLEQPTEAAQTGLSALFLLNKVPYRLMVVKERGK